MSVLGRLDALSNSRVAQDAVDPVTGVPRMTKDAIRLSCIKQNGYSSPELNDSIYLNYSGYQKIENLDEYINVKSLHLESNGIAKIENISHMTHLRSLYLSKNAIKSIEGLDGLKSLSTLDLSCNTISSIPDLTALEQLKTLNLSSNLISNFSDISNLKGCAHLSIIDLSDNQLSGDIRDGLLSILQELPSLVTLILKGNPCVSATAQYRRLLISHLPGLRFLDDRPVFEDERITSEAWRTGGSEGEKRARELLANRQRAQDKERLEHVDAYRASILARKQAELEQLNAERLARGEPPLSSIAELPRRLPPVSYGRVSSRYHLESVRLQRLAERAEAVARAEGFNGTGIIDLGREYWNSEASGALRAPDGSLVNPYDEDGVGYGVLPAGDRAPGAVVLSEAAEEADPSETDLINRVDADLAESEKAAKDKALMNEILHPQAHIQVPAQTQAKWDAAADSVLQKIVKAARFDFAKAAKAFRKAVKGGMVFSVDESQADAYTEDACRLRYAAIATFDKKSEMKESNEHIPAAAGAIFREGDRDVRLNNEEKDAEELSSSVSEAIRHVINEYSNASIPVEFQVSADAPIPSLSPEKVLVKDDFALPSFVTSRGPNKMELPSALGNDTDETDEESPMPLSREKITSGLQAIQAAKADRPTQLDELD